MYDLLWKSHVAKVLWLSAFVFLFFLVIYPIQRAELSLLIETPSDSILRVYWSGDGESFSATRSSFVYYPDGGRPLRLKLGDLKNISKLRLQASRKNTTVVLKELSIQQLGYKTMDFTFPSALVSVTPGRHIESFSLDRNTLKFVNTRPTSRLIFSIDPVPVLKRTMLEQYAIAVIYYAGFALLISACFWIVFYLLVNVISILRGFLPKDSNQSGDAGKKNSVDKNKIVTLVSCFLLLLLLASLFGKGEDVFWAQNVFGTANAPYSDALTWLRGAFNFMNDFPTKTYRPTVNLFIGSIYSLTGVLLAVPLFSIIFFVFNAVLIVLVGFREGKYYQLLLLFLMITFFTQLVLPLNVGQVMMDFPPFVFTCFGLFFIGFALKCKKIHFSLLYLGLFFIGVAAAVRGVQLAGGLIVVFFVITVIQERTKQFKVLFPLVFFLLPIVFDSFLQKKYGVYNNGLYSIFCFYSDSHHSYTKAGKELLKILQLSGSELLLSYFRFLFSVDGLKIFGGYIEDILLYGLANLQTKIYYILLILCGLVAALRQFVSFDTSDGCTASVDADGKWLIFKRCNGQTPHFTLIQMCCHCLLVPGLIWLFPSYSTWILGVYLLAILVVSMAMRMYLAGSCVAMYIGAGILFAMMGMPGKDRVLASFAFTLPLGYLLFLLEDYRLLSLCRNKGLTMLVLSNVLILLFLYSGHMIFPLARNGFELKESTVRKISDDSGLDLSLYYSDKGKIFYTRRDMYEPGKNRSYEKIHCSHGDFNASFKTPCTIE